MRRVGLLVEFAVTCLFLLRPDARGMVLLAFGAPSHTETGWPAGLGEGRNNRTIALRDASLSGSGTAVKGLHLFDPRTGEPAARTARTWAFAATAAQADALSTAFFIMPEAEITSFCAAHPQVGAAAITGDGALLLLGALRSQTAG